MCYFIAILLAVILTGIITVYFLEKSSYNAGICRYCGSSLENFATDSQGGIGFRCPFCEYTTWITYKSIIKKTKV